MSNGGYRERTYLLTQMDRVNENEQLIKEREIGIAQI